MDILSEKGPMFTSDFWKQVFWKVEITLSLTFIDHPLFGGQTKLVNKNIEDILRPYVANKPTKWEQH